MKTNKLYIFFLLVFAFWLGCAQISAFAQQEESESEDTEQTETTQQETASEQEADEEEASEATEEEGTESEVQFGDEESDAEQEKEEQGFFSKLAFWKSWTTPDAPKDPLEWHENVQNYLSVTEEEYYRNGYTRINDKWLPVFMLRRFNMMDKQYNHTLVVKGKPQRMPSIKGIETIPYGLQVQNLGFDVQMPKFPSVSREQKQLDEIEATQLCSIQLGLYGFEETIWLPDKRKEIRDLAETWNAGNSTD